MYVTLRSNTGDYYRLDWLLVEFRLKEDAKVKKWSKIGLFGPDLEAFWQLKFHKRRMGGKWENNFPRIFIFLNQRRGYTLRNIINFEFLSRLDYQTKTMNREGSGPGWFLESSLICPDLKTSERSASGRWGGLWLYFIKCELSESSI